MTVVQLPSLLIPRACESVGFNKRLAQKPHGAMFGKVVEHVTQPQDAMGLPDPHGQLLKKAHSKTKRLSDVR